MRIDIRGRGAGKTRDMIEWLMEQPHGTIPKRGIVVAYNQNRHWILEQLEHMYPGQGVKYINQIFTVAEVKGLARDYWELGVDNIDTVFAEVFDNRVVYGTLEDRNA